MLVCYIAFTTTRLATELERMRDDSAGHLESTRQWLHDLTLWTDLITAYTYTLHLVGMPVSAVIKQAGDQLQALWCEFYLTASLWDWLHCSDWQSDAHAI